MATFSDRLRELRTQRGFSQQDLADRTNQTKQAISQYERGVRRPDMDTLLALCDIFNVSVDYMTGKEDVTPRLVDGNGIQILDNPECHHHTNPETEQIAQYIYEDSDLRLLFDAARGSDPENLKLAAELLKRMKETNNDG
jgi:transcriptional regulator with XRE-family HTH domain